MWSKLVIPSAPFFLICLVNIQKHTFKGFWKSKTSYHLTPKEIQNSRESVRFSSKFHNLMVSTNDHYTVQGIVQCKAEFYGH